MGHSCLNTRSLVLSFKIMLHCHLYFNFKIINLIFHFPMYLQTLSLPLPPSPQQMRVSSSLCKLELPTWYKGKSLSTPTTPKWRRERSPTSWRRKGDTQSAVVTPDNISLTGHSTPLHLPSPRATNYRWSSYKEEENSEDSSIPKFTSTVKSSNSFLSYRQPYLGWRTQERLKLSSTYLNSPSQRLACTLLNQGQRHLRKLAE